MRIVYSLLGALALFAAIIGLLVSGSENDAGERLDGFVASGVIALVGIGFMVGAAAFRPVAVGSAAAPAQPYYPPQQYPPQY
jgi:hypothetical protein